VISQFCYSFLNILLIPKNFDLENVIWSIFFFLHFTVPLPCIVSDWSDWSAPDASGVRFRVRYMTRPALNGGKECPDLIQLGRGIV
jgi:hypothetical protein